MRPSEELTFFKLEGAGNDFIFFHSARESNFRQDQRELLFKNVSRLCDRHFGIGADGLVILNHESPERVSWDFWNADGSEAEMCGNAARCAFTLLYQLGWIARSATLFTKAGPIEGEIFPDREVKVLVPYADSGKLLTAGGVRGFFVNTGVPHFVLEETLFVGPEAKDSCAKIRGAVEFGKGGTNVTLVRALPDGSIVARTYERGVEDFTLSCGTGALAAGAWAMMKLGKSSVSVEMPGGRLSVSKESGGLALKGPARIVFNGTLNPGVLL